MCLATIYREKDNSILMENTAHISVAGNRVELQDLFGVRKSIDGCIKAVDLENNTVVVHCDEDK